MLVFNPMDPDAVDILAFDFTKALLPNEVLMGGAQLLSVTCSASSATNPDLNPGEIVLGPLSYDSTGTQILVPVGNLSSRNGNDYEFEVGSHSTQSPKFKVARGLLQVRVS